MRKLFETSKLPIILCIVWAAILVQSVSLQGQNASSGSANSAINQLAKSFSGGQVVQSVQINGTATWTSGGLEDSGTVTLTASTNGSSQMQLILASAGQRTESQSGMGESADCKWAGNDGISHEISQSNCTRPALWFLPALSLQPTLLPEYVSALDLGTGSVGLDGQIYRHVQGQLLFADLPTAIALDLAQQSTSDFGLDPATLLPAVLAYSVLPDSGTPTPIAIEIHYSDYRDINGVKIPFLIQRYVNGSLQLAITVNTAQLG